MFATTEGLFELSYHRPSSGTWMTGMAKWIRGVGSVTFESVCAATSTYIADAVSSAYVQVANLVQSFGQADAEMRVDSDAVRDATEFLGRLISVNATPPKVYPSGGDAIIFVWDKPVGKEYAYYADDVISLTHVPSSGPEWQVDIDLKDEFALTAFSTYIGR